MTQRRINMADIVLGEPLPWDVYDLDNRLLLCKGYVVGRGHQIESLIQRGLFIEAKCLPAKAGEQAGRTQEKPSSLRLINTASRQLERLLFGLHGESDAHNKLVDVARTIIFAAEINHDVALASILLNQSECPYTIRHCIDTAIVAALVSRSLNKTPDETTSITAASLTMNVGMLRHHEQFQNKEGALSTNEIELIQAHPKASVAMLRQAGIDDEDWLSYVLLHHENEDGSGYPQGMRGNAIPHNVKIVAIADRYCARVSARSYRKPLLPNAALRDILLADKNNINLELSAIFIREFGIYPIGTFVRLSNGEIAVVTGKGASTTTPIVQSFIDPRGAPLSFPIKRDTSKSLFSILRVLCKEQAPLCFSLQHLWGDGAAL